MSGTARTIGLVEDCARALRAPYVPAPLLELGQCGAYLELVWPQLAPSIETAGFLGSALYMADMALDAVDTVSQPILDRATLRGGAMSDADLDQLGAVLDVFHWVQPQLLLILAALAEGREQPRVGGQGKPEPRETSARERRHLATAIEFASVQAGPLPLVADALQLDSVPDLYRAVAVWPGYLDVAWEELENLAAYPLFRQRGRALYFYARSSSRFLARPIEVSRAVLLARGAQSEDIDRAESVIDAALPATATLMMHCCAMRVGLGMTEREVVRPT
ncbi:MAG: halocarboxylic acid dehydrogenase DehI family protein [Dehalococcoidia bacterium]